MHFDFTKKDYLLNTYINQSFLKNGKVSVERIKPIVGTIAVIHGFGALIDHKNITITT